MFIFHAPTVATRDIIVRWEGALIIRWKEGFIILCYSFFLSNHLLIFFQNPT